MKRIESNIFALMQSAQETKEMARDFQTKLFQEVVKDFSLDILDQKAMRKQLEEKGLKLHRVEEVRPESKRFELFVYATFDNNFHKGYRILTEQRKDGLYIGDFEMTELPPSHDSKLKTGDNVETIHDTISGTGEEISSKVAKKFNEVVEEAKDMTIMGAMKQLGLDEDNPIHLIKFMDMVANDKVEFAHIVDVDQSNQGIYIAKTYAKHNDKVIAGHRVHMTVNDDGCDIVIGELVLEAV